MISEILIALILTGTSRSVTFKGVRNVTAGVNETAIITIGRALKRR